MVTGGKLWWADEDSAQLGTVTKRDGRNLVILRNKTSGVVHMKVYDREAQKGKQAPRHQHTNTQVNMVPYCLPFAGCTYHSGRNPCQINNGGCSQLCFPTSENTRSCSCTVGYNLRTDRMSCEGTFPKICTLEEPIFICKHFIFYDCNWNIRYIFVIFQHLLHYMWSNPLMFSAVFELYTGHRAFIT